MQDAPAINAASSSKCEIALLIDKLRPSVWRGRRVYRTVGNGSFARPILAVNRGLH
jgi:hypothetical protein